jgi:hypothetical protein
MTNAHCLPSKIVSAKNCSDKILTVFRKRSKSNDLGEIEIVKAKCQKILEHYPSELNARRNIKDYAFIKLDRKLNLTQVMLSSEGVPTNENYTIWSVRSKNLYKSSLVSHVCRSIEKNYITPQYRSPYSSIVSFKDCQIEASHAGSPIIDEKGSVRAMVTGGNEELLKELGTITGDHKLGVALNFACLATNAPGIDNLFDDSHCEPLSFEEAEKLRINEMNQELKNKREFELREWSFFNGNDLYQWKLLKEGSNWITVPDCIKNEKTFRKEYGRFLHLFPKKEASERLKVKVWKNYGNPMINRNLQNEYISIMAEGYAVINIFPKVQLKKTQSELKFSIFESNLLDFLGREIFVRDDLSLSFCPATDK